MPRPLPWTLVCAWVDRAGYGEEEIMLLEAGLHAMDEVFLADAARRASKPPQAS